MLFVQFEFHDYVSVCLNIVEKETKGEKERKSVCLVVPLVCYILLLCAFFCIPFLLLSVFFVCLSMCVAFYLFFSSSSFPFSPISSPFGFYCHKPGDPDRLRYFVEDNTSFQIFAEFHREEPLYLYRGIEPETASPPSSPPSQGPAPKSYASLSSNRSSTLQDQFRCSLILRDHTCLVYGEDHGNLEAAHIYPLHVCSPLHLIVFHLLCSG